MARIPVVPRAREHKKIVEEPKKEEPSRSLIREIFSVTLFFCGLFLFISLISYFWQSSSTTPDGYPIIKKNWMGPLAGYLSYLLFSRLGLCSFVIVVWSLCGARFLWQKRELTTKSQIQIVVLSSVALLLSSSTILSVLWGVEGGGLLGNYLFEKINPYFSSFGTILVLFPLVLISIGELLGDGIGFFVTRLFKKENLSKILTSWINVGKIGNHTVDILADTITSSVTKVNKTIKHNENLAKGEGEVELEYDHRPFVIGGGRDETKDKLRKKSRREKNVVVENEFEPEFEIEEDGGGVDFDLELDRPELELKPIISQKNVPIEKLKPAKPAKQKVVKEDEYQHPGVELLSLSDSSEIFRPTDKELLDNSKRVTETLGNFRVGGKVVEVQPGPVVTLYQFEPAPGVKVGRIVALADDLALSLKVASVRVFAPVPGRGTVGIEVPNSQREIVRLRDVISDPSFNDPKQDLPLALGKDTLGEPFTFDLAKMPHLLIAGSTGTGKSVCINSILLSLLYKNTPAELQLILIDPKMLELSVYEDIPHLKAPVVTNPKKARGVLWWAVQEMERRYSLMKDLGVRNLAGFNTKVKESGEPVVELEEEEVVAVSNDEDKSIKTVQSSRSLEKPRILEELPRIVIVVDELADLMLTVGREIEELLTRLAQKARAAGIHLILATQRPSVNVITGLIKANFPSRISFKVASSIDARTVLDTAGAEKLLGQGDMLFLSPITGRPKRMHSPFVSDNEVHKVVGWLKNQGQPSYDQEIEKMVAQIDSEEESESSDPFKNNELDPLYEQAVRMIIEKGFASTSMVQRAFRIGYNRAARILDVMEKEGIVGPADGSKPRPLLSSNRF